MKKIIKKIFFGKKFSQRFFRRLFDISLEGMNIGTGGRNPKENGEIFVIHYALSKEKQPIVFDVGAQGGGYIDAVLRVPNIQARIYAFEPRKKEFDELVGRYKDRVAVEHIAFGEKAGSGTLFSPPGMRGVSSLIKIHGQYTDSERVTVDTIDSYCEHNKIDSITLLKLDVEGGELNCLKGASNMLIRTIYIQFEFSISSREYRINFKDIWELLIPTHRIYRIVKDGLIEIGNPEKMEEVMFTTNYLAIRNK